LCDHKGRDVQSANYILRRHTYTLGHPVYQYRTLLPTALNHIAIYRRIDLIAAIMDYLPI